MITFGIFWHHETVCNTWLHKTKNIRCLCGKVISVCHLWSFIESSYAAPLREYALTKVGSCRRFTAEGKPETKIIHGYGTKFHPKQYECTNIRKRYEKSNLQVWCSPTVAPSQSTKENMYVQHSLRHPIVPLTDQILHRLYERDISICTV